MSEDFTDEFANADLNDTRRGRRLVKVAAALAKSPSASISAASGGWSETMAAYRDHGSPTALIEEDLTESRVVSAKLTMLGVDLDSLGEQLQREGVRKFRTAYQQLLATLDSRIKLQETAA